MDMASSPLCCFGTRRQEQGLRRDDGGSEDEDKKSILGTRRACCAAQFHHKTDTASNMPTRRRWLRGAKRVFVRSRPCGLTALSHDAGVVVERREGHQDSDHAFSREQVAAANIQAFFRGHLARRASRALRSVVKLQAFARGLYVRKLADVAIRCMQVLVRLQVRVRARQLLDMYKEE